MSPSNIPSKPSDAYCAACNHQRRKCPPDCVLLPYFPTSETQKFLNAQRLFGASKMRKILRPLSKENRDAAAANIIFQSTMRAEDPAGGCYPLILDLCSKIDSASRVLEQRIQLLEILRAAKGLYGRTSINNSFPKQQPPPPPENNDGASSSSPSPGLECDFLECLSDVKERPLPDGVSTLEESYPRKPRADDVAKPR